MSDINMNEYWTQITKRNVMISRFFFNCQHGGSDHNPANFDYSNFTLTKKNYCLNTANRGQRRKWSREDIKQVIYVCFKSSFIQRGYRNE